METRRITTLDELRGIATEVLDFCGMHHGYHIITLSGNLGVGKTAFVKELGKILGIAQEITSPTFVIMKSYPLHVHPTFAKLTHIDAYRIETDEELSVLGFDVLTHEPKTLICIEWPERVEALIPHDRVRVEIILNPDCTRTVSYGI